MAAETVFRLDRVSAAVLDRWYHKAKPGADAKLPLWRLTARHR